MKNLVLILTLAFVSSPLAAQHVHHGPTDLRDDQPRFSFFVGGGVAQMDDERAFVIELEPRIELRRTERRIVELALPLLWLPEPRPMPATEDAVFPGELGISELRRGELKVDSTLAWLPSLELTPRTLRCCQFSFFVGAGVVYEPGRCSELLLDTLDASGTPLRTGTAESADEVAPAITAGVSWSRRSSERFEVRAKLRSLVTFHDERRIESSLGEIVVPSTTSWGITLTLGVRIKN